MFVKSHNRKVLSMFWVGVCGDHRGVVLGVRERVAVIEAG